MTIFVQFNPQSSRWVNLHLHLRSLELLNAMYVTGPWQFFWNYAGLFDFDQDSKLKGITQTQNNFSHSIIGHARHTRSTRCTWANRCISSHESCTLIFASMRRKMNEKWDLYCHMNRFLARWHLISHGRQDLKHKFHGLVNKALNYGS